jgi:hypothetical protein
MSALQRGILVRIFVEDSASPVAQVRVGPDKKLEQILAENLNPRQYVNHFVYDLYKNKPNTEMVLSMTLREMNLDSTLDLIILSERPHTLSDYQRGYNDGFRDAFQSMQTEGYLTYQQATQTKLDF